MADFDELVERACIATGMADFGPDGWQQGLERMIWATHQDVGSNPATISRIKDKIVARLSNRLRIEHWYSERANEPLPEVEGPLVIVGLPRTATTALLHILSNDPQFRFLRRWEAEYSVPPPTVQTEQDDPRRLAARAVPNAQVIAAVDGPIEDGPVLELNFSSLEFYIPIPSYTNWWRTQDFTNAFHYHERVLRLLHSQRPPHRWLLKAPMFLHQLNDLVARYPGARFLWTHREPTASMGSVCSVIQRAQQEFAPSHRRDPAELGSHVLDHWADGCRSAIAARDAIGEDRFHDVYQQDYQADPLGTVEKIYQFANLKLSDQVRQKMELWAAQNQRGSRGAHTYAVGDFGLTDGQIREAFMPYIERFGHPSASEPMGAWSAWGRLPA